MVSLTTLRALVFLPLAVYADLQPFIQSSEHLSGDLSNYPHQKFISDPEVVAPVANIIKEPQYGASPESLVTWAPTGPGIQVIGPQLLDTETLSVVYQAPTFGADNFGLSVQSCNNTDYLVWWSGQSLEGRGAGTHYVFDSNYQSVYNVTPVGFEHADCHDMFLTPQCTAVITLMEPRRDDLSRFGIDAGWIMEAYFQEIDLVTGEALFTWRASDHVNVDDTFWKPDIRGAQAFQGHSKADSWDFFHINSVEKDWRGNYLVSSRHMHSLYYIDGQSGEIHWTLGGRRNTFEDLCNGHATDFAWQHHARWTDDTLTAISVFDDRNSRYIKSADPISRGMVIELDYMTMTADLIGSYTAISDIRSFRKGGMQHLPNDNALVGWGNEPGFTEYSQNGTVLWDVSFGPLGLDRDTADNYRAMKVNWTGTPTWSPKIAAGPSQAEANQLLFNAGDDLQMTELVNNDTAYFSWNGATKVTKWLVLASSTTPRLVSVSQVWCEVPRTGFETSILVGNNARYVRAVAVAADEEILGVTPVLDMRTGRTLKQDWSQLDFSGEWRQRNMDAADETRYGTDDFNALRWTAELRTLQREWRQTEDRQWTIICVLAVGWFLSALFFTLFYRAALVERASELVAACKNGGRGLRSWRWRRAYGAPGPQRDELYDDDVSVGSLEAADFEFDVANGIAEMGQVEGGRLLPAYSEASGADEKQR